MSKLTIQSACSLLPTGVGNRRFPSVSNIHYYFSTASNKKSNRIHGSSDSFSKGKPTHKTKLNLDMNFFDQVEHDKHTSKTTSDVNNHHNSHQPSRRTLRKKGVLYDADSGEVLECLFCKIHTGEEPGRIEYEDEKFVVFHTIDPATHLHLLVTPRQHITSVRSLKGLEGAKLIRELIDIGKLALKEENCKNAKFCFHIPPYTSIDHIHLHAIADHHTSGWWPSMKYPAWNTMYCKNAIDFIKELEEGSSLT